MNDSTVMNELKLNRKKYIKTCKTLNSTQEKKPTNIHVFFFFNSSSLFLFVVEALKKTNGKTRATPKLLSYNHNNNNNTNKLFTLTTHLYRFFCIFFFHFQGHL